MILNRHKRPDIAKKFPDYNQENVGFEFSHKFNDIEIPKCVSVELSYNEQLLAASEREIKKLELS